MTSNDVPLGSGATAGRRRVLGRGPGAPRGEQDAGTVSAPEELETEVPESEAVPPAGVVGEPEAVSVSEGPQAGVPESEAVPAAGVVGEAEPVFGGPVVGVPQAEAGFEAEVVSVGEMAAEAVSVSGGPEVGVPQAEAGFELKPVPEPVTLPEAEAETVPQSVPQEGGEGESGGVFKVRLANFEGPFDLLLQLISKHKLDVTEVALSKVTDEFMAYIRAMGPDWDLDETTEFLVVAATLLDLKAARLLPAAQVEDEADLALLEARDLLFARLLQYRAYKQIADIFNRRLDEEARRYPRTVGLEPHHADLLPEVVISIGPEGFARLAVKAMQPKPKPQVYVDHIHAPLVSVQEQAGIVVARLRELGEASFRLLVEDADGTLTVVARFLALLELYREKAVALDQETALGELLVRWTGGEGEAEPTVTDEFDRPPEPPEPPKEDKT
ncbi:segregation/condensation protein A [Streptomyces sp. NPDC102270]|uniref:segregation and condensation protein A n=1 Tax=Streptomyces sp. NPDC102270 TaxID=3366150 RepID=UPI00382457DE